MARTPGESREPWVKVKVGLRRSDKVGQLPNAAARWGWTCTLLEAKTQRRMGVFGSRRHLRDLLGAEGRYVADFLAVGLLHEIPRASAAGPPWCDSGRCVRDYQDVKPGELVVHDYRREQRDPTNADRQADWRDRNKDGDGGVWDQTDPVPEVTPDPPRNVSDNAQRNATSNDPRNATHNGPDNADRNGLLTRAGNDGDGDGESRDHSTLKPGESARGNDPSENGGTTSGPRLTAAQLDAWRSYDRVQWAPFKAAWLARGFPWPPGGDPSDDPEDSVRARLWVIAQDDPTGLGRLVAGAPAGSRPHQAVGHVFARWNAERAGASDRANAADAEWERAKAAERTDAGKALAAIGGERLDFGDGA